MSFEDKNFTEPFILVADSNFFQFFNYKLLAGDPLTALKGTNKNIGLNG
jgi:putative ABC transport system permease protein